MYVHCRSLSKTHVVIIHGVGLQRCLFQFNQAYQSLHILKQATSNGSTFFVECLFFQPLSRRTGDRVSLSVKAMKRIILLSLLAIMFSGITFYGQETVEYGEYYKGTEHQEIRTMSGNDGNFVLLECDFYHSDSFEDISNGLQRKVWFCIEQEEVPLFIRFLDNLYERFVFCVRNGSESQFLDGIKLPRIGKCIVANFEKQTGFVLSDCVNTFGPFYASGSQDSGISQEMNQAIINFFGEPIQPRDSISFDYYFEDENGFKVENRYVTECPFRFNFPEDISDLRKSLNDLLPQHLKVN